MFTEIDIENATVTVEFYGYYTPARTWGLPEECYPAEGQCDWKVMDGKVYVDEKLAVPLDGDHIKYISEQYKAVIQKHVWECILNKEFEYYNLDFDDEY